MVDVPGATLRKCTRMVAIILTVIINENQENVDFRVEADANKPGFPIWNPPSLLSVARHLSLPLTPSGAETLVFWAS